MEIRTKKKQQIVSVYNSWENLSLITFTDKWIANVNCSNHSMCSNMVFFYSKFLDHRLNKGYTREKIKLSLINWKASHEWLNMMWNMYIAMNCAPHSLCHFKLSSINKTKTVSDIDIPFSTFLFFFSLVRSWLDILLKKICFHFS